MIINYDKTRILPNFVKILCHSHDAWIVGSGAAYLLDVKIDVPADWDVIVPFSQWNNLAFSIPPNSRTNSNGGVEINTTDGYEIDFWPGELGWYFGQLQKFPAYAVHLKTHTFCHIERGYHK